ncbi:Ion transport 2 domain-containing protein [Planococcus antarcticus DSM 14505]|uniref:Ion transport 2 domain-containing protein n=1 Tax=Planococcus antarcticus DSM 14505 TaxID=1185653 RepID=A0A1C7DJ45_9BACL|nr:potassium channel family protein [Planococcus antarcticus]ANU11609.1 metal transporter [Planococcus antarcticus DSM 14505]EIM08084.1 Ion transport 2 domain-containing protein [Planococcus antarcticus DSM 14505]
MIATILIGLMILLMLLNLYYFFTNQQHKESFIHMSLFTKLFLVMTAVTFGFAIIYYLLALNNNVLRLNDETGRVAGDDFWDFLYFSGVTMLSVGYGDLVPVGVARFFAVIQAALGLLLPSAYFVKAFGEMTNHEKDGQGNRSDKTVENEEVKNSE